MKKSYFILILLLIFVFNANAQYKNYRFSFASNYIFNKTQNGTYLSNSGFDAAFTKSFHLIKYGSLLNTGIDVGVNSVAFFSAINIGIEKYFVFNKNEISISAGTQQGLELFKPKPMYMADFYGRVEYLYNFYKRLNIGVFAEYHYYTLPSYKFYSTVNQFSEIRIGLSFVIFKKIYI